MVYEKTKLKAQKLIIENPITQIYLEDYVHGDSQFSMITRDGPPVACVVPFLTPDTLLLIRQYRIVWGEWSWEIPCGHADPPEPLIEAAQRELEEETGFRANTITFQYQYLLSAISRQTYHIFHAKDLQETRQNLDETEQIEVHPTTLTEVKKLISNNRIKHAPSLLALNDLFTQSK